MSPESRDPPLTVGLGRRRASTAVRAAGQFPTPRYFADALVERFFPHLGERDVVLDPAAGGGNLLLAVPSHVPAFGVELDPTLAAHAARRTGRLVMHGDFRTVAIPRWLRPSAVLANPPYSARLFDAFLDRCYDLLRPDGTAGFLVPSYFFTASRVSEFSPRWDVEHHLVPRDVFPGLKYPLSFTVFRRGAGRGLVGFALFAEADAVRDLRRAYRALLVDGAPDSRVPIWREVVLQALTALGGEADLPAIYREVEGRRSSRQRANPFWKDKVRQELQLHCDRIDRGRYALRRTA